MLSKRERPVFKDRMHRRSINFVHAVQVMNPLQVQLVVDKTSLQVCHCLLWELLILYLGWRDCASTFPSSDVFTLGKSKMFLAQQNVSLFQIIVLNLDPSNWAMFRIRIVFLGNSESRCLQLAWFDGLKQRRLMRVEVLQQIAWKTLSRLLRSRFRVETARRSDWVWHTLLLLANLNQVAPRSISRFALLRVRISFHLDFSAVHRKSRNILFRQYRHFRMIRTSLRSCFKLFRHRFENILNLFFARLSACFHLINWHS